MEAFFIDYIERLEALHRDFIATYDRLPAEALDWVPGQEMNSLCVLVVHTSGSARFWIGDVALQESSNRNRDSEFLAKGIGHAALSQHFSDLETYVRQGLEGLRLADFPTIRTIPGRDGQVRQVTVGWALLHALEHTGMHLGHAQLTRQLWEQR